MRIHNKDVPNKLVFKYCKVIKLLEEKFDTDLEYRRIEIHNEIFDHVECYRSLHRREDREFSKALDKVVLDLTEEGRENE